MEGRVGRPKKYEGLITVVTFRLPSATYELLTREAGKAGLSNTEFLVNLIQNLDSKHGSEVSALREKIKSLEEENQSLKEELLLKKQSLRNWGGSSKHLRDLEMDEDVVKIVDDFKAQFLRNESGTPFKFWVERLFSRVEKDFLKRAKIIKNKKAIVGMITRRLLEFEEERKQVSK